MSASIEELGQHHNRNVFDCGVPELNQFLQQQARQKNVKNISKTYVHCSKSPPFTINGFYTLTGYSVISPPHKNDKKYPHPLNAVKLARLAINNKKQKQGLGEVLLIDAIYRTVLVAEQISAIGLFVDPMTPDVISFYQQYEFLMANPDDPSRLEMWLPIKTCKEVVHSFSQ